jgi:hypothetical protein
LIGWAGFDAHPEIVAMSMLIMSGFLKRKQQGVDCKMCEEDKINSWRIEWLSLLADCEIGKF